MTNTSPDISPAKLDPASVLRRSLSMLLKHWSVFLLVSAVAAFVPALVRIVLTVGDPGLMFSSLPIQFTAQALTYTLSFLFQAVVVYIVYQSLRGRSAPAGEAMRRGLARFVPVLLSSLASGLAVGLGTMLFVVPGLILMCVLAVVIPACVVEKLGVADSFRRSMELTQGNRLRIFLLFLVVGLLNALLVGAVTYALVSPAFSFAVGAMVRLNLALAAASVVPAAFGMVMVAVLYYELRLLREGVSLEKLAQVFD